MKAMKVRDFSPCHSWLWISTPFWGVNVLRQTEGFISQVSMPMGTTSPNCAFSWFPRKVLRFWQGIRDLLVGQAPKPLSFRGRGACRGPGGGVSGGPGAAGGGGGEAEGPEAKRRMGFPQLRHRVRVPRVILGQRISSGGFIGGFQGLLGRPILFVLSFFCGGSEAKEGFLI